MLTRNENIYSRQETLKTLHDLQNFFFPMKLEEEEEDDLDEIEMLKRKQKEIKRELIKKNRPEDHDSEEDET